MRSFLRGQRWLAEPVFAIGFFALWAMAEVGRHQLVPGSVRTESPFWAALLLLSVAIGISRISPIGALVAGTALLVGQLLVPAAIFGAPLIYLGFVPVIVVVAATVGGRWRSVALVFALGAGISVAGLLAWWFGAGRGDAAARTMLFVLCAAFAAIAWAAGTLAGMAASQRESRNQLARLSDELRLAEVEAAATSEREQVAQDVHDIMAHSLSVILAQADGARLVAPERPGVMTDSLSTISDTARASLTEVRVLIETLVGSPEGAQHPGLQHLDDLVQRFSGSGVEVALERFGATAGLTAAQQLAAYRIVQEALTNALKHAGPGATARVALDQREDGLALSITSRPADPAQAVSTTSGGRGLIGMRERARLAGGWLDAGADDDTPGGYLVTAYIPAATSRAVTA
ncbi:histidine kinase [Leifsonia sp. fls2-241-R2A-40a]|uniref:histidine kinase n=1 Tax=Leifsonia sp. fls2-241-R2A-40a TaxID=3040290 RepID=UPI00254CBFA6|nr:histidine kinase [Leifsonia sp. fls2-241-R2A-40a]